jgi:hypothetical protein
MRSLVPVVLAAAAISILPLQPSFADKREQQGSDCHFTIKKHYVAGFGNVVHRHFGERCNVAVARKMPAGPGSAKWPWESASR